MNDKIKTISAQFFNKKEIIPNLLIVWGLGIWLFSYIPTTLFGGENALFYLTRHLFYYLQSLMNVTGFMLLWAIVKNKITKKDMLMFFCISTILTKLAIFPWLHDFFKANQIYFDIFKTSPDGKSVVSFQYARIMVLAIIFIFTAAFFVYFKKTVLKVFVFFIIIAFYIFFYFMHGFIGKELYLLSTKQIEVQMKMVATNYEHSDVFCKKLNYNCIILDNKETYKNSRESIVNRINSSFSAKDESNEIIDHYWKDFVKNKEDIKIYTESSFTTNNLRAVNFAFKKVDENHTFILQDNRNLEYMLDLYLIYFSIAFNVFLSIWGFGIMWLYKKHKNMDKNQQLEKLININSNNSNDKDE